MSPTNHVTPLDRASCWEPSFSGIAVPNHRKTQCASIPNTTEMRTAVSQLNIYSLSEWMARNKSKLSVYQLKCSSQKVEQVRKLRNVVYSVLSRISVLDIVHKTKSKCLAGDIGGAPHAPPHPHGGPAPRSCSPGQKTQKRRAWTIPAKKHPRPPPLGQNPIATQHLATNTVASLKVRTRQRA